MAQLYPFGHLLQSSVPAHHRALAAERQTAAEQRELSRARKVANARERQNSTAKPLHAVRIGVTVDVQDSRTGGAFHDKSTKPKYPTPQISVKFRVYHYSESPCDNCSVVRRIVF